MPIPLGILAVAGAGAGGAQYAALAAALGSSGPTLQAFPWTSGVGFGTRYSNPTYSSNTSYVVNFSPDNKFLAAPTSPNARRGDVYAWSDAGWGTLYSSGQANDAYQITWSPNQAYIALGVYGTDALRIARWTSSGYGTYFTNTTYPAATYGYDVSFSTTGNEVGFVGNVSPYVNMWAWSDSGFGTKYSNPGTLPTGAAYGIAITSNTLFVAHSTSPRITAYPWSSSGYGTKYANPATLPPDNATYVRTTSDGSNVFITSSGTTPTFGAWAFNSGWGTKFSNPPSLDADTYQSVAVSKDNDAVGIAGGNASTPRYAYWAWSASGFGTKYTSPDTSPLNGEPTDVTFSR